jgi:hypothetical protein
MPTPCWPIDIQRMMQNAVPHPGRTAYRIADLARDLPADRQVVTRWIERPTTQPRYIARAFAQLFGVPLAEVPAVEGTAAPPIGAKVARHPAGQSS